MVTSVVVKNSANQLKKMQNLENDDSETDADNVEMSDEDTNEHEDDEDTNEHEDDEDTNEHEDDEDMSDDSESQNESKFNGNAGWADVFQKILKTNKPKKKKTLVLSRAKKLSEVVPKEVKPPLPFDVDGEVVNEEVKKETIEKSTVEDSQSKKSGKKHPTLRTKPSISDRGRERILQKIATKGVVQLFNAVKQQQTMLEKKLIEAGPLERKREQVLKSIDKRAFLDVLMGGSKSIPVANEKSETKTEEKSDEKVWSVLHDDFVMGAKLKDWDKKASSEEESSGAEAMDSD
ncbi:hypothetical protein PV327_003973 [Microctonus hyperodae]|uniref:RRP15-like protein n=1 Tax=Microctonus hyperodae TaxID=165561 RepID=A0AA39G527_MICHY|nr:hypothetical protein PV327_003973 [Microctonus hyperodae]